MKVLVPLLVCLSVVLQATHGQTILDIVKSEGLNTLATALEKTNLTDIFSQRGSLTLFAPSDEAFAKLPSGALDSLLADPQQLNDTLSYHAVQGAMTSNLIVNNMHAETLLPKEQIILDFENGILRINRQIKVTKADIEATNGVVHVIDSVLIPMRTRPTSVEGPPIGGVGLMDLVVKNELSSVMALAQHSGLFNQLNSDGPYTLLAPNDQAKFASGDMASLGRIMTDPKLVANLLKFHVIPGVFKSSDIKDGQSVQTLNGHNIVFKRDTQGDIFVNGAKFLSPDIEANNGVMHIIDTILEPKNTFNKSILDVLGSSGERFSTLLEVITRTNMTNLLNGTDSLTLFAPNDEAFSKLSPISVYTAHELKNILSNHVLNRAVKSTEFFNVSQSNTSLAGQNITLEFVDGVLRINRNANVTKSDVEASNGFIHVIDCLLIPNNTNTENLDAVESEDKLSTIHPVFSSMVKKTKEKFGLFDELVAKNGYTLLAPNLEARFAPLDQLTKGKIMNDTRMIHELMKHYVLPFNVISSGIYKQQDFSSLKNYNFAMFERNSQGDLTVNGFNVSFSDESNYNKIVHFIDGFFIPDSFVNPKGLLDVMRYVYYLYDAVSLFEGSSLSKLINEGGPYTVLAPINDYLSGGINPAMQAEIDSNQSVKDNLVKYHIIPGVLMSYDLKNEQTVTTINGQNISFSNSEAGLTVNGINVVQTDIYASNGIIHLIEDILVPESEINQQANLVETLKGYQFDILASLIEVAGLTEILDRESYIIFAPTDSAFDASFSPEEMNSLLVSNTTTLTEILKYHVTNFVNDFSFTQDHTVGTLLGEDHKLRTNSYRRQYELGKPVTSFLTIDGTPISRTIQASNGVIHVIDAVLIPPTGNVSDVIADEINLSTFNSAIKMVGLDTLLSSDGHFTVFAPTNAAFKKLPAGILDKFLKDEKKLSLLLKSHILPTVVYKAGHRINIEQTIGLGNLHMNKELREISASVTNYVERAVIEQFDLKATNGVVHKIDTVLDRGFFT